MFPDYGNPLVKIGAKSPSRLSVRGAEFVANFEGYVSKPYNDPADNATIGFGHLLHYGPVDAHDRAKYPIGLTRKQALALLRADADVAAAAVRHFIVRPLTQTQFDALCDFAFNCGTNSLRATGVSHAVNDGRTSILRTELLRWVHGSNGKEIPGLVTRRTAEANLYLNGIYGA